jgi:hypothetical protein
VTAVQSMLSVDPGLRPGVVLWERTGEGLWCIRKVSWRLDPWVLSTKCDVAVCELQWIFPKKPGQKTGARPQDILQLAFRAGFTLASIPAHRRMALLPQTWRGSTALSKEQVQAGIARSLTPAEKELFRDVPESRHGDILDAIGIGRGAQKVLHTDEYDWHFGK